MNLLNGIPTQVGAGKHNVQAILGTGSYTLAYSVDDKAAQLIVGATGVQHIVELPTCLITATITGDASVSINQVSY